MVDTPGCLWHLTVDILSANSRFAADAVSDACIALPQGLHMSTRPFLLQYHEQHLPACEVVR